MADWVTAVTDLRVRLYDTDTSKLFWQKKVFGTQDGTNKTFKTFEQRRVDDFTSSAAPIGVFVDGAPVTVTADYPEIGQFELTTAPTQVQDLRATYYVRYFTDDELTGFIIQGNQWLGGGVNYLSVVDGLRPACISFASAEAYQNMAVRFASMPSEQYRLEDSPDDKTEAPLSKYFQMAESFRKQAKMLRDHYYTRQGKPLAPNYSVVIGAVPNIP